MSLGTTKASTQDTSTGTPVATAVNEDVSATVLQAAVQVGNKTTYSETARTSLSLADNPTSGNLTTSGFAGASGANLFDLGNALAVMCRATCDTASKSITGQLIFYDELNTPVSKSEQVNFNSDASLRLASGSGDFISQRALVDAGSARKARFFLTAVSGAAWSVYCRPV